MVILVVVIAYISLFLELTWFNVPSKVGFFENLKRKASKGMYLFRGLCISIAFATFLYPCIYWLYFHKMNPISESPYLLFIAVFLILLGRFISVTSVWRIRKHNSQKGEDFFLHTQGIYAISRNPIQIGLYLFLLGLWLLFSSYYFLIGILIYIAYMHNRIQAEEAFLKEYFGDSYDEYCKETNRYI